MTRLEREAVLEVLRERLAGGTNDLRDAFGLSDRDAVVMEARLESAVRKLETPRKRRVTLRQRMNLGIPKGHRP